MWHAKSVSFTGSVEEYLWTLQHLHTKSSLMSVQSSGSLEGTPSLVPALHVPNTDCVFSNIPRQWWRPGKVSWNILRRVYLVCLFVWCPCLENERENLLKATKHIGIGGETCWLLANVYVTVTRQLQSPLSLFGWLLAPRTGPCFCAQASALPWRQIRAEWR